MPSSCLRPSVRALVPVLALVVTIAGCQVVMEKFSHKLTHWKMLGDEAVEDPIQAVGGDGIVFVPSQDSPHLTRAKLTAASPETLVNYYSPIFVQQRVDTKKLRFPYPPEYDLIGSAHLKRDGGKLKSYVAGDPKVYAICKKLPIDGRDHIQLTYTAWYPAHPRTKALDVEEADIDSCVLRLTLDADNAPLFYETIAACGCFHKVFVQRWVEESARKVFGPPEKDKKYAVERTVEDAIDWEVAGVVDEPRERPRRPVVFLKAGDHRVIGMGSAARLRVPAAPLQHPYEMVSYAELYAIPVDGSKEQAAFFNMEDGGKVRGGARKKERFLMSFIGVDDAGRPRADDQIKLHFDQASWNDPTIYNKYLRLPPGLIGAEQRK
jgi:hypothetical protein